MKSKSISSEKNKSTRMRQICVESQRPSKVKRASMDGGGLALCGQVETECNKESICTWGCASAKYQSPSRVRGVCLYKGCLEWVSESEYVEKGIHMSWGQSSIF